MGEEREIFKGGNLMSVIAYLKTLTNEQLRHHRVEGLPTLHYLARLTFRTGDEDLLDRIIMILKESGYDINQTTNRYSARKRASLGFTALLAAVEQSNVILVDCLIKNGARTDIRDDRGFSACHWAVIVGDLKCLDKLVQSGAPMTSTDKEKSGDVHPVLHTAVDEGRTEMVFYMLERGLVDVNEEALYRGVLSEEAFSSFPHRYNTTTSLETVNMNFTPLARAVRMRKIPIIEVLLRQEGVKLSGFSELHFCIVEGDTEVACLLKNYFSNTDLANDKILDKWALHCLHPKISFEESRVDMTKTLIMHYIDSGWNINSFSKPRTALCFPFLFRNAWSLDGDETIDHQLNINMYSLIHLACLNKSDEIIKFLVEEGADINCKTDGNAQLTPLQILILTEQWKSAVYLIEKGADVNAIGHFKNLNFTKFVRSTTSVSESELFTNFNSLELLLRIGSKDEDAMTALDCMLRKDGIIWHGINEFYLAIEGGNPALVLKVLQHEKSMKKMKEDFTWITVQESVETEKVQIHKIPSLLVLFHSLISRICEVSDLDVAAFSEVIKLLVSYGYNCNLVACDEDNKVCLGFKEPLIFHALKIDFKMRSNQLLKTLLEVDHVRLNVRNTQGKNPVEYIIDVWDTHCVVYGNQCWKAKADGCLATIKILINHGVNVQQLVIGANFNFHYGYLPLMKLLYYAGAKIESDFFNLAPVCHIGYCGTRAFSKQIIELQAWKEKFDKDFAINLQHICRLSIRKTVENANDLRHLEVVLPRNVKEELLGEFIP